MVCSMTGFGRSEVTDSGRKFTVEIKSVNNRYLDMSIKMPRMFNVLEADIRAELKHYMKRGKVDIFISYEDMTVSDSTVKYNRQIAGEYLSCLRKMAEDYNLENDIRLSTLSRYPDVLTTQDSDIDEAVFREPIMLALNKAGQQFADSRIREGEFLKKDLMDKLAVMQEDVDFITERSPEIVEEYKKNLMTKVQDLLQDKQMDESRVLQEVTIFADKVCIDEELVRLRSHISAVNQTLGNQADKDSDKPDATDTGIGRKLDFLAQEMNREANTALSKSSDLEISNRAIDIKTAIEKVREQIQNIE